MFKAINLNFYLKLSLATFGCLIPLNADAQISADGTTSTTVNQAGNNFTTEQGDRVGDNLFHSFEEFSVPTMGSASFNNAADIANIFSRVTGSNISTIDGLLSANGAANLFLINPNGIIFGENARLNLGGSFFASTADSLLFEGNTEFSASNPQAPPLLEVSIPIGLNFRDNPGEIVNRSFVQNNTGDSVGLEVAPGKNLTLVGGNINFESGQVTARGGNIQLGGLSAAGIVGINEDASLDFPEDVARANINLSNAADVDVTSTGGGSITINTRNLNLESGVFGASQIRAGITADSITAEAQAGHIIINATDNVTIDDSFIGNQVASEAVGNSGNVTIATGSLILTNGGRIVARTLGEGNAGSVSINARDTVTIDGENPLGFTSIITSQASLGSIGSAGDITITTDTLSVTNGGSIVASTFAEGNAGLVDINAKDTVIFNGESRGKVPSGVGTQVTQGAIGNAGGVNITTGSLQVRNGAQISASTFGEGNAGLVKINATDTVIFDGESTRGIPSGAVSIVESGAVGNSGGVNISADSLQVINGAQINSNTFGEGNAGLITIDASNNVNFSGIGNFNFSGLGSQVAPGATGNSQGIKITTNSLGLTDGGQVNANTFGGGSAGLITIDASDNITLDGKNINSIFSGIFSQVAPIATGNAGGVNITTGSLIVTNGGAIDASTFGEGNAGLIKIKANDNVVFDGEDQEGFASGVISQVNPGALGDAGGVNITTDSLQVTKGGRINTSTFGEGNAGSITINAADTIIFDGETKRQVSSAVTSQVNSGAVGDAGDVNITTGSLQVTNGAQISTSTFANGNAGSVTINATNTVIFDGESTRRVSSAATSGVGPRAVGDAGGVNITTDSLQVTNEAQINTSTFGVGNAGSVNINAIDTVDFDSSSAFSSVESGAVGNAGGVTIITNSLTLTNRSEVGTNTAGQGNAGSIIINALDKVVIDGDSFSSAVVSDVLPGGLGDAGGVDITTGFLNLTNGGLVSASTAGEGNAGNVTVNAKESIVITGVTNFFRSGLSANALVSSGNGGDINVFTNQLTINDGGTIEASNFDSFDVFEPGTGEPGDINIEANTISLSNQARIEAETQSATGNSANINLQIADDLILQNSSFISAQALNEANGGNLDIDTEFIVAFPNQNNDIIANASQGNGGKINITADALFGIEERSLNPITNDINASSDFGLQGEISVNTPEVDPTSGLIELPETVADASDQISQNPCEQGIGSEFIITGKGGLPPNPNETLNSDETRVGLVEPVTLRQGDGETGRRGEEIDEGENDMLSEKSRLPSSSIPTIPAADKPPN